MSTFRKTPEALAGLSPEQYRVTQQSGTEAPGTGELLDNREPGIYVDIVSGEPLFAELLATDIEQGRKRAGRCFAWHDPDRSPLGRRGQPSGACLRGWPGRPGRAALLHQLGIAALRARR